MQPSIPEFRASARGLPVVLHARVLSGQGGGPDKTILRSVRYLDSTRLKVAAAYIHPRGDRGIELIRSRADELGCPLWEISETGPLDVGTVWRFHGLCRGLGVRVWHGHDHKSNALGLLLRRFRRMKLVTTVHGWTRDTVRSRFYYHIDSWCLRHYDHVIAVSPRHVEHCHRRGIGNDRVTYVPNGIETADHSGHVDRAARRVSLGVRPDARVIGVVGRLSVEKGVDRAVRTVADLRRRDDRIELHLIGDGPQRERLEALARRLGVADSVRFWGWQSDVRPLYPMMDVLLLPSHTEGSPNVVLESMAAGTAVAGTDVGNVRELLDGGRCGVVLGADPGAWHDAIRTLLSGAARRRALARRAQQRVEEHYGFDRRMERVAAIYERLLSETDGAAERRAA